VPREQVGQPAANKDKKEAAKEQYR
jgi:hypothetical protein